MPWSGTPPNETFSRDNGTHTGSTVWAQDEAAAVGIVTNRHDTHDQDIAAGLNLALKKDGGNQPTANIPMGSFKLTGLAAGSTAGDSVRYEQVLLLAGGTMTGTIAGFTSTGIDDNATGERLQIGDGVAAWGALGAQYDHRHAVNDQLVIYWGGAGGGATGGGNLLACGGTHASRAGDWALRSGTTEILDYDVSDSEITSSVAVNLTDNELRRPKLKDYSEAVNAIGSIGGGTQDIDLTLGNVVTGTVDTSTTTFTFSNPPASGSGGSFTLILTNGGSQTVNWPAAVDWQGGNAPTLTASGVDVLTFLTTDGGTTWYGFPAGLNMG